MAWAAAPLAIGGSLLSGFGAIQQGQAANAQAEANEQQMARQSQLEQTAAMETQTERTRQLQTSIGTANALFGARGLNPNSESGLAIQSGLERGADTNIQRTAFNSQQAASNSALAGQAALQSGQSALSAGWMKGIGSFFQAGATAYDKYGPKKAGS